jgi:hypothetical protein
LSQSLGYIDCGRGAGVEFFLCQCCGLALRGRSAARERDPCLIAAGFGVMGRYVSDQDQQRCAQIVFCRIDAIARGLDGATIAAEEIELPTGVKAGLELIIGACLPAACRDRAGLISDS